MQDDQPTGLSNPNLVRNKVLQDTTTINIVGSMSQTGILQLTYSENVDIFFNETRRLTNKNFTTVFKFDMLRGDSLYSAKLS